MPRFENIGKALRLLREKQGKSQKDLAQSAGITSAMLSNYETGEKQPSLDSLGKVLDALGLYLGKIDDALDMVNDRPPRRDQLDADEVAGGTAAGDGSPVDVRRFIGAEAPLSPELERGFAEMIRGFRQIARYMYRSVLESGRRRGG
jgi:transcriptional regulator with XRE-family HTH domain